MKISGFTVVRNAIQYNYPVVEAIRAVLPVCDEFVVNIGQSDDDTLGLIKSMREPKVKILETWWEMSEGPGVLAKQTNYALDVCRHEWAFYVQADELIHEADLGKLKGLMRDYHDSDVDAMRFKWLHFYGSFYRYRIDAGWFQKQNRIIRNNGTMESYGDAFAFRRKDGRPVNQIDTGCLLYHYGWVHEPQMMNARRQNHAAIGFDLQDKQSTEKIYDYGDLNRFPVYFGTHPKVMEERVARHELSRKDRSEIGKKYWWFPPKIFKIRYKTGRRVREKIT